jgi:hypothetical protein
MVQQLTMQKSNGWFAGLEISLLLINFGPCRKKVCGRSATAFIAGR